MYLPLTEATIYTGFTPQPPGLLSHFYKGIGIFRNHSFAKNCILGWGSDPRYLPLNLNGVVWSVLLGSPSTQKPHPLARHGSNGCDQQKRTYGSHGKRGVVSWPVRASRTFDASKWALRNTSCKVRYIILIN